jgi:hypothetical protein
MLFIEAVLSKWKDASENRDSQPDLVSAKRKGGAAFFAVIKFYNF